MAHKTFISYKYSEAQELRDRIIKAFGDDASYYQGETITIVTDVSYIISFSFFFIFSVDVSVKSGEALVSP